MESETTRFVERLVCHNPVTVARYLLNSDFVSNTSKYWPRSLRTFVAELPGGDPALRERLFLPISAATRMLSSADLDEVRNTLHTFLAAFAIDPSYVSDDDAPVGGSSSSSAPVATVVVGGDDSSAAAEVLHETIAELLPLRTEVKFWAPDAPKPTEVTDEMFKLDAYTLIRKLHDSPVVIQTSKYWPRLLRTFLARHLVKAGMSEELAERLQRPITKETAYVSRAERNAINEHLGQYLANIEKIDEDLARHGILQEHEMAHDYILVRKDDAVDVSRRLINSVYIRKKNSYWPKELRMWLAESFPLCPEDMKENLKKPTKEMIPLSEKDKEHIRELCVAFVKG